MNSLALTIEMSSEKINVSLLLPPKKLLKPTYNEFINYCINSPNSNINLTTGNSIPDLIITRDPTLLPPTLSHSLLLDSPSSIDLLATRSSINKIIYQLIERIHVDGNDILTTPPSIELIPSSFSPSPPSLLLPAICKPTQACGNTTAHTMTFLQHPSQLQFLPDNPIIIQSYIPHHSILYKIFVIGSSKYWIVPRPSIYFSNEETVGERELEGLEIPNYTSSIPFTFNTQQLKKTFDKAPPLPTTNLNLKLIEEIIRQIHQITDIHLFGFDLLIEKGKEDSLNYYHLIDINYLQSYDGVLPEEFASSLHNYLLEIYHKRRGNE